MISLDYYHPRSAILRAVSHSNLSVLANETLSVSLCREIDNVFGAVRTCFDHVLSKGAFLWDDPDRDHSDHGRSNELVNPCPAWIHRFI